MFNKKYNYTTDIKCCMTCRFEASPSYDDAYYCNHPEQKRLDNKPKRFYVSPCSCCELYKE